MAEYEFPEFQPIAGETRDERERRETEFYQREAERARDHWRAIRGANQEYFETVQKEEGKAPTPKNNEQLRKHVERGRASADQVRSEYQSVIAEIDSDDTRTESWKQERRDKAHAEMVAKLRKAHEREKETIDNTIRHIRREMNSTFGEDGSSVIAYRDAQDRAGRLTTEEDAVRLIEQAERSSDRTLALAAFHRSVSKLWMEAVSTFTDSFPEYGAKAQELSHVINLRRDPQHAMARSISYRSL